ncbi:MAG TPA: hypothetical protein VMU04_07295 [Candidatus Acidoferrum sp.]|nr:hypothetical protein [Candidatus Acidoferrum sp.]
MRIEIGGGERPAKRGGALPGLRLPAGTLCLLLCALCFRAAGQSYSVSWYKIAGGGGTSTGGTYTVSGTIGQHDAGGPMTGGSFSVTGGFWSLIAAVQTPGAPTLTITTSGSSVIVSWPYPSTGWTLQQNPSVTHAAGWMTSGYTISNNGSVNSITITSPTGSLFFRLASP